MQQKSTPLKKPAVSSNHNTRLRGPLPKTPAGTKPSTTATVTKSHAPNPHLCAVCSGPQNKNKFSKPERFIRCNVCRRRGKNLYQPTKHDTDPSNSLQPTPPASTCPARCSSVPRSTRGSAATASPVKSATEGRTRNRWWWWRRRQRRPPRPAGGWYSVISATGDITWPALDCGTCPMVRERKHSLHFCFINRLLFRSLIPN